VTRFNNNVKATLPIPEPYTITFDPPTPPARPKRYLLRLINTSFDSTFIFSIDGHMLQIVGADFVPIHSYWNTSVLVGIGQRYHVIVNATDPTKAGNYWIRTLKADCFRFNQGKASRGYETTGILRYSSSQALPNTTKWDNISTDCSDETYDSLRPIVPWEVGVPANDPTGGVGENFTVMLKGGQSTIFPLALFSMGGPDFSPLQIDYGNPTFLNLNFSGKWDPLKVVIPENYKATDWVSPDLQMGDRSDKTASVIPIITESNHVVGVHGPPRPAGQHHRGTSSE
jgi:Multicopper oxidase